MASGAYLAQQVRGPCACHMPGAAHDESRPACQPRCLGGQAVQQEQKVREKIICISLEIGP